MPRRMASAGHQLGQLIGNWFEEHFVFPLLSTVAHALDLYLDSRFVKRPARGERIIWRDAEGNEVNYDFVLELGGSLERIGIPVAFIECCWRRGARHSKDKARDDSGKLLPMRSVYPTARFLGMIVAGDFTEPARELVRSRGIDLFYIPKEIVVRAFLENGLSIDYPDIAPEAEKARVAATFVANFTAGRKRAVARSLTQLVGRAALDSYVDRVRSKLGALPQQISFALQQSFPPVTFGSVAEATDFLRNPTFNVENPTTGFIYKVLYSDGSGFERTVDSVDALRELHGQISALAEHMDALATGNVAGITTQDVM